MRVTRYIQAVLLGSGILVLLNMFVTWSVPATAHDWHVLRGCVVLGGLFGVVVRVLLDAVREDL